MHFRIDSYVLSWGRHLEGADGGVGGEVERKDVPYPLVSLRVREGDMGPHADIAKATT